MNKVFVRNLPYRTSPEEIEVIATKWGRVLEVFLPLDEQRRPRGFGFIATKSERDASAIVSGLNGYELAGRTLHAELARPKPGRSEV